ncbi:hypothetical protein HAX54_017032 [Datura stramonium]|uniref:Uncharacterized protein n=1 Tax=Datura stramonium TaxID=4076 RepID=A0ABS8S078_DATST|nr:hypothetical protein [Datura stramonium]
MKDLELDELSEDDQPLSWKWKNTKSWDQAGRESPSKKHPCKDQKDQNQRKTLAEEELELNVVAKSSKPKKIKVEEGSIMAASTAPVEEPDSMAALRHENEQLKAKVGGLTQKLLQAHEAANERMAMLLQKLSGLSS